MGAGSTCRRPLYLATIERHNAATANPAMLNWAERTQLAARRGDEVSELSEVAQLALTSYPARLGSARLARPRCCYRLPALQPRRRLQARERVRPRLGQWSVAAPIPCVHLALC